MSDVAVEYIELGLRLGRHQDGLVDSYYGPVEIKERIDSEELRSPGLLADDAARLRESLDGLEEDRRKWLEAQLEGLETAARKLGGAEIPFEEEVELYYGVPAHRTPESEFEAAHKAIDALLSGTHSLEERYRAWREDDAIPAERLAEVVSRLNSGLRERAAELAGLPEGESVDYEYVTDKPWTAYNYYRGDLHSHIEVNTDAPSVPDARPRVGRARDVSRTPHGARVEGAAPNADRSARGDDRAHPDPAVGAVRGHRDRRRRDCARGRAAGVHGVLR